MNNYENIVLFSNFNYSDAFIGISHDDRAIYDYNKMVEFLIAKEGITEMEAIEWIDYNTIRFLPYQENAPIIMYPCSLEDICK